MLIVKFILDSNVKVYSIAIHCSCSDNEATFVLRFKGKSSGSRLPSVSTFSRTEEFQCVYEVLWSIQNQSFSLLDIKIVFSCSSRKIMTHQHHLSSL